VYCIHFDYIKVLHLLVERGWHAIVREKGLRGEASTLLGIVIFEFQSKSPDYDILGSASDRIHEIMTSSIPAAIQKLHQELKELNSGWEKQIADLKIVYHYWASYGDYSDCDLCGDDREAEMSQADYDGLVLYAASSWGNPASKWQNEKWTSYRADAKWIDEAYFVRYRVVSDDGTETLGEWEKVDEAFYEKHLDDVGMSVASKPKGSYASETNRTMSPPGYNMVGNQHYGEWKTGSDGQSFWEFYGRYALMRNLMWGPGYHPMYFDDYNTWDRTYRRPGSANHGKRYYGKKDQFGTYGSRSAHLTKGSQVRTQNKADFKQPPSTVRAGSGRRSGGGK